MNPYTQQVSQHLHRLTAAQRQQALADLDDILASGVTAEELGDPQAYAAELEDELARPGFRLPGGLGFGKQARARIWDPTNPKLFVPRAFGLGWRLNVGALAVKLGWLRPDDVDADVVAAIPEEVRRLQRVLPYLAAGEATLYALLAARKERVPRHWDAVGRVDGWMNRAWLVLPVGAAYAIAAWGSRPAEGEDAVVRPALALSGTGLIDALMFATLAAAKPGKKHWWVGPLVVGVPVAAELAATVLPIREGLTNVTDAK